MEVHIGTDWGYRGDYRIFTWKLRYGAPTLVYQGLKSGSPKRTEILFFIARLLGQAVFQYDLRYKKISLLALSV